VLEGGEFAPIDLSNRLYVNRQVIFVAYELPEGADKPQFVERMVRNLEDQLNLKVLPYPADSKEEVVGVIDQLSKLLNVSMDETKIIRYQNKNKPNPYASYYMFFAVLETPAYI
jgi:hypothetical protein